MTTKSDEALIALRRIQRRTEQASRLLAATAGLTPSQLRVMQILNERSETSAGEVAKLTTLKQATITSLVDKLTERGLVTRRRCDTDRRRVWLALMPSGAATIKSVPDLLQETFAVRFNSLPNWHQSMLLSSLERITALLDAEDIDASPFLDIGALDETP